MLAKPASRRARSVIGQENSFERRQIIAAHMPTARGAATMNPRAADVPGMSGTGA